MDLRQLERWSREALVDEASRRGVASPALLTRRELLDAIAASAERDGETVTRSAVSRARRFIERLAFGTATPPADAAAPPPAPAPPRSVSPPLPAAPLAPARSTTPTAVAVRVTPAAPVVPTRAAASPAVPLASLPPAPIAPAVTRGASEAPAAEPENDAEPVTIPPPGAEPVATRTMARLLAAQGHIERAQAIYDALLGGEPEAPSAPALAIAPGAAPQDVPTLRAVNGVTPPVRRAIDLVTALVVDPTTLFVCWEVSDAGLRRARAVAGGGAALALRVMIAASDGAGHVTTRELSRDALPEVGETFVTGLPPGALCTVAVGVTGARFVALAHASPAETPPATPSASLSLVARVHPLAGGTTATAATASHVVLAGVAASTRLAEAARAVALERAEAAPTAVAPSSPGSDESRGMPSSPGASGSRRW